ncbi:MAG: GMC family oxidoreductase [Pseudomonadota bacterium]
MKPLSCDVLVVGSGAGGATAAMVLARRGARVLVVEKGPYHTLADFERDELRICRRDFFVPFVSDEPNLLRSSPDGAFGRSNEGWTACCVGGGTVHMSGYFYRLHELDFRARSELGDVDGAEVWDWPFGYADLAPYYDRVEALLGVTGQAGDNPFDAPRQMPYPLPPLRDHPAAGTLDDTLRSLGWHPFHTPRAVLSQSYDGRPRCTYSGLCGSYGCETGAKSSALSAVLPKAVATGRCRVLSGHLVNEILCADDGKVTGAVLRDRDGSEKRIEARAVCLAAGAIQSARLLLNSRSARFPRGLANSNDRVGRHLFFSTFAHVEAEFLREGGGQRLAEFDDPLPWLGRSVQDHYLLDGQGGRRKGGTLRFDFVHPNPIYNAEHVAVRHGQVIWGQALKQALRRRFQQGKTLEVEIFGEFLPTPDTRVEVDDKVRDRFGAPVARVTVVQHPRNLEIAGELAGHARQAFEALGADSIDVVVPSGVTYVLQGGTCVAGTDPALSVLDAGCRSHEVDNLYVVDGSFMPSSGGVPITLTIHANAWRVAEQLAARLARREL